MKEVVRIALIKVLISPSRNFDCTKDCQTVPKGGSALIWRFQLLSFATLFTWLESAAMPRFVFGVDCAEPLPTNAAMASGGSITRFACCG